LIALAQVVWPHPGQADVIFLNDGNRVCGLLEREDRDHIFFQQRMAGSGRYQPRIFLRDEVRRIVVTVDRQRLESLRHGQWSDYQDLAEELAVESADPEADDLALRLYLIVARHAEEPRRAAGFRGAIRVATATEAATPLSRRIRALALQTYEDDASWFDGSTVVPPGIEPLSPATQARLAAVAAEIRLRRQGLPDSLGQLIKDPLTRDALSAVQPAATWQRFTEIASKPKLNNADTARLLNVELAIEALSDATPPAPLPRDGAWSVLVGLNRPPVHLVDFSNVSEFDLNATVFRNGGWERPK
jgi:hypothetical protein